MAAGDGRLTADELDERLERALSARTYDDLAVLVADLPAAGTALAPLPGPLAAVLPGAVAPAPPKELVKIHVTSGQSERVGRWTVPARMDLKVTSGHVTVDFTEAVITQPTLHIDAEVRSGHIRWSPSRASPSTWTTWRCAAGTSRSARRGATACRCSCGSPSPGRAAAATSWPGRGGGRSGSGCGARRMPYAIAA